jgi:serine/threonine-protein kinase
VAEHDVDFVPEILPLLLDAYAKSQQMQRAEEFLGRIIERYHGISPVLALTKLFSRTQGEAAAIEFLTRQLRQRPSVRGLMALINATLHSATGDARENLLILQDLARKLVEGQAITTHCSEEKSGVRQRLTLFLEICDAVSYAHRHRVVHGDLKPANILVASEGTVKLLDFGIAIVIDRDGGRDVMRTTHLSPAYAAPEQLAGGRIGTSTDVHALGVILFELLTGSLPWASEASSLTLAVQRLLVTQVPAPSSAVGAESPFAADAIAGDLDAIVGTALRRDPAARHADAQALAEDVRRYLDHRLVQAPAHAPSAS